VLLALAGWLPAPAFAPITFVAGASAVNTGGVSGAFNSTGANLIVVIASNFAGGTSGVSDNKGNSYSVATSCSANNSPVSIQYSTPSTVGAGHTVTITNGGGFAATGYVRSYSGAATTSVLDQMSCTCATGTTVSSGSITPTSNGQLVVGGATFNQVYSSGPGGTGGLVDDGHNNQNLLAQIGSAMGDVVQTTAGAANPNWTVSGSVQFCVGVASFKAAPVAAGGGRVLIF
jgi:hypothetical protein